MNDLNLRVAALKLCASPKRFAEMRGALAPLPPKWSNSKDKHVLQFVAAESSAAQVAAVREIFEQPAALPFLADLLFASPLKHPVRGALTKLFSNNENAKKEKTMHSNALLLSALRESLRKIAVHIGGKGAVDVDIINDSLVSVGGCLNNFPNGRNALGQELAYFIPLLPLTLRRYWLSLSDAQLELSPTRRNELYLFIQNLLRFHVNFMVNYKSELMMKLQLSQPLKFINELADKVAQDTDMPWDVRSIAGLSLGHNARFFNVFDEYLIMCQGINNFEALPVKAASLLVLQKSDYVTRAEQILDILKRILDQVRAAGNITNLLVYMSKHLYTYAKSLASIGLKDRALIMYNLILTLLLRFILEHIATSVESIRHMCGNLLEQILQHAKAVGQVNIINQIYVQFERHPMPVNAVALMLEQLVEVMGTRSVLTSYPSVFEKMFPLYLGHEDSVNSLFKCMMIGAHKEESVKDWHNLWCMALIKAAKPCDARLPAIERLIKVAVQLEPPVVVELLKHRGLPFSTKLTAMMTARRFTLQRNIKVLITEQSEQVKAAIVGVDDNTRLQALCFVVETPRLSEPYTQIDLDIIISYMEHNVNNPCAHVRQIGYGLLQKACKRLELNLAQQMKNDKSKLNDKHMLMKFLNTMLNMLALNLFPTANYGRRWLSLRLMRDYIDMLQRLKMPFASRLSKHTCTFLNNCLRDSYEHNKMLAVELLRIVQQCVTQQPDEMLQLLLSQRPPDSITGAYQLQVYCQAEQVANELTDKPAMLPHYESRYYAVLQCCLQQLRLGIVAAETDLTHAAKTNPLYGLLFASRHLLQQLDLHQLAKEQLWQDYIQQLLSECMRISEIMLPVVGCDSPEGYMPEPLKEETTEEALTEQEVRDKATEETLKEQQIKEKTAEATLQKKATEETLQKKTAEATLQKKTTEETFKEKTTEETLQNKSTEETVQKKTTAANLKEKTTEETLKEQTTEETLKAQTTEETLKDQPIEGSTEQILDELDDVATQLDEAAITSQLVLLCAWRSVKEISNILGSMLQAAPLQQEQQQHYLISAQQVATIGEHFVMLLSEIKHRGAFEQAYVGFTMLCRRFWHSDEPSLNKLPPIWLDEAMQLISGIDVVASGKLCPTRRSAGMPYMLQALICTELKLGTHNTFNKCMCLLLQVCEQRQPGDVAATSRSHALNIMRALFRCSELAELVGEFIGRGVICALESLLATEWSERNCATLLLSTLVVRIFGVERARSELGGLHVRNRMTGRIFFTRYPKLFDYFYAGLSEAADQRHATVGGQAVKLEAMLQLLSRLYPSALEGAESSLNLSKFVPFLQQICCVHDNVTRQKASQVLANILSPAAAMNRIKEICMLLRVMNFKYRKNTLVKINLNGLHGHLLQLLELYGIVQWNKPRLVYTLMHTLAITAVWMHHRDIFIFKSLLNVLVAIMLDAKDNKEFPPGLKYALEGLYKLDDHAIYERCETYSISTKFYQLYAFQFQRLTQKVEKIWQLMLISLVRPTRLPPALVKLKIDVWLYIMLQQANNAPRTRGLIDSYELKNFDFDVDVLNYYKSLQKAQIESLAQYIRDSPELQQHLMKLVRLIRAPSLIGHLYALLATLNRFELTAKQLLDSKHVVAEPGLVLCMTRAITHNGMQPQLWLPLLRYALNIGSPNQKPYLRYRSAQLLDRLSQHQHQLLATNDVELIGSYMRLVLQLLVDESELVRNFMAEMVSSWMGLNTSNEQPKTEHNLPLRLQPTVAEKYFLQHMLDCLQKFAKDGAFLFGLFIMIVEPFVSAELLENRLTDDHLDAGCEEFDVFDKQESNLYCEGLRVAAQVIISFRTAFPKNMELIEVLDVLDKLCSYND